MEYKRQEADLKRAIGRLRVPELDEAVAAGEILADVRKLWQRADASEKHELLRGMVASVQVDLLSARIVGVTPKPAFWSLFESARVDSSRVVLLKPDDVKRWLAERATSDLVMVETGEAPSLVTHNSCLVFPHRLQAEWLARGVAWRSQAA